jgi:uncharacterized repeat protein (TIGR03803 family)
MKDLAQDRRGNGARWLDRWPAVLRVVAGLLAGLWLCPPALAGEPEVLSPLKIAERVTAPLMTGQDGRLYGTSSGGRHGQGMVFRLADDGQREVLHHFAGPDGDWPRGLLQAPDGGLMGVTFRGGRFNDGTVFRIDPRGRLETLHHFQRSPTGGGWPQAELMQSRDGEFFGSTSLGGPADAGAIFRLKGNGQITWLHWFDPDRGDGGGPAGRLIEASDGRFYGTTVYGGRRGHGTVFSMRRNGTLKVLHSFDFEGTDGYHPNTGVTEGPDGLLYGVAEGHRQNRRGLIYRLPRKGPLEVVHDFPPPSEQNGREPLLPLTLGRDGALYGSTSQGGIGGQSGTLFRFTTGGQLTTLHAFGPQDPVGGDTSCALLERADGEFIGATSAGGPKGRGSIFRLQLSPP